MSKYESISDHFPGMPPGSVYEHTWTEKTPNGDSGLVDNKGYGMRIKSVLLQDERYFRKLAEVSDMPTERPDDPQRPSDASKSGGTEEDADRFKHADPEIDKAISGIFWDRPSEEDAIDPLQSIIFTKLGEASALFMSNPQPGTKQIMPTEQLTKIGTDMYGAIQQLLAEARIDELEMISIYRDDLIREKIAGRLEQLAALGGKSDQGKSSKISGSEQPMPDYADNQVEIATELLNLPKGKNKPLLWDMDVLVGHILLAIAKAKSNENSREVNYTLSVDTSEDFKDGFDEAIRQTVAIKDERDKELTSVIDLLLKAQKPRAGDIKAQSSAQGKE